LFFASFRNQRSRVFVCSASHRQQLPQEGQMDSIIYLVGLVVVIMAILSFLGLR